MPAPARKKSSSRSKMRRSENIKKNMFTFTLCKACNNPLLPYHVCHKCGIYKNTKVLHIRNK